MRVACLIFLFALLAAVLAKPRPLHDRQAPASRFAIVRMTVLLIRITGLQIRIGMLLIRYGALVVLAAIIAIVRRGSRRWVSHRQALRLARARELPAPRESDLKHNRCGHEGAVQGGPFRNDTAHAQVQSRARQRSRLSTKQGWPAPGRRERATRQASASVRPHESAIPTGSPP